MGTISSAFKNLFATNRTQNIEELSDKNLMDEYIDSAEALGRLYNKASGKKAQNDATVAYRKVFEINRELQRRNVKLNLLSPLLDDERDSVRVVAAASLARPNDDKCIKILKDVAERPEVNPSNVSMLARFFLNNIDELQHSS